MMEINQITEKIIGCAYEVGNTLGHGFLEKVYENALRLRYEKQDYT
jgi:GxxExxY protein